MTLALTAVASTTQKMQDETNEFLNATRDQGVKVESFWNTSLKTAAADYKISLTGSIADKFTLTQTADGAATFTLSDKEGTKLGTVTLGGTAVTDANSPKQSDTIITKDADLTVAKSNNA